jgi:hypothetical protein
MLLNLSRSRPGAAASATVALGLVLLVGCASTQAADGQAAGEPASPGIGDTAQMAVSRTGEGLADAALSPLEDLNLRRDEIPALLKDARSPYEVNGLATMTCAELAGRIGQLDAILGADWDFQEPAEDELTDAERAERRAAQVSDATLGYVSSEARGFIPFRGAVRFVSGANRHEKAMARALAIGTQQRAFLKGVGRERGCAPPASPLPLPPEPTPAIVFKGDQPVMAPEIVPVTISDATPEEN